MAAGFIGLLSSMLPERRAHDLGGAIPVALPALFLCERPRRLKHRFGGILFAPFPHPNVDRSGISANVAVCASSECRGRVRRRYKTGQPFLIEPVLIKKFPLLRVLDHAVLPRRVTMNG
jgi:hypothetical protein